MFIIHTTQNKSASPYTLYATCSGLSPSETSYWSNKTKLSFRTATSELATEKMSIDNLGNLKLTGDLISSGQAIMNIDKVNDKEEVLSTDDDNKDTLGLEDTKEIEETKDQEMTIKIFYCSTSIEEFTSNKKGN